MAQLRLSKLPDRTPVKLSIIVSPELHRSLADYAEAYAQTYGQAEPLSELICAMLAMFLETDRGFARRRREGSGS